MVVVVFSLDLVESHGSSPPAIDRLRLCETCVWSSFPFSHPEGDFTSIPRRVIHKSDTHQPRSPRPWYASTPGNLYNRNSSNVYSQSGNPSDPYPIQSGWQHLKWNDLSIANSPSISSSERSISFMFAARFGMFSSVNQSFRLKKIQIRALTTDAFRGHAFGKNACLVQVRPETDQDGVGGYTLLLRDLLHDFVVGEGSTGGSKWGVSRDCDPF